MIRTWKNILEAAREDENRMVITDQQRKKLIRTIRLTIIFGIIGIVLIVGFVIYKLIIR